MKTLGAQDEPTPKAGTPGLPPPRPGQLSVAWKTVFIIGWIGVVGAFGAVWWACRVAGIAAWWMGPETNPRSFFINALPFVPPLAVIAMASFNVKITCWAGIVAGVLVSAIALGDLDWPGLAIVELAIGVCGVLISCACLGGRLRPAPNDDQTDVAVTDVVPVEVTPPEGLVPAEVTPPEGLVPD